MIGILQRTLGQQRTFGQQRTLGQQRTKRFSRTNKLQNSHNKSKKTKSYTPTINQELVSFKSASSRKDQIIQCKLEPQLEIIIKNKCYHYSSSIAKTFLLKRLSINKHVDPTFIITPKQANANCWFNTMFVSLFISDKGRKFFHFLRQLMIEGTQSNGRPIPTKLWDGFSLLNFAIEASLSGTEYAYKLNTNIIISHIYNSIPDNYKKRLTYLTKVGNAGNPLRYYMSLMYYLENKSIQLLFCDSFQNIREKMKHLEHIPHIIVIEIFENEASQQEKPIHFSVNVNDGQQIKYKLDSSVVRDISKQHFCAMITCEGIEMGYDGISHSRMVPMEWKSLLNTDTIWKFKGNTMKWSFLQSYQMLLYYRV